jgi:hypothetical protein
MNGERKEPPWDIQARILAYEVRAVRLYRALQESRGFILHPLNKTIPLARL